MSSSQVDINSASVDELKNLPGISGSLAQNIVDYRNANGPFKSVEELKNVKGMTDSKFNKVKDSVTAGSSGSPSMPDSSSPGGASSSPGSAPDATNTPPGTSSY
jgi:competence protein ComEA